MDPRISIGSKQTDQVLDHDFLIIVIERLKRVEANGPLLSGWIEYDDVGQTMEWQRAPARTARRSPSGSRMMTPDPASKSWTIICTSVDFP